MRKLYAFVFALCVLASTSFAEVDSKARAILDDIRMGRDNVNAIQDLRVMNTVTIPDGSIAASKLVANVVSLYDTNATTTITSYSATSVGQLLLGGAGTGTGSIWRASATGTNSWVQVFKFAKL